MNEISWPVLLVLCLLAVLVMGGASDVYFGHSEVYPGQVTQHTYYPPYTTHRWVAGTKERPGHFETTHHPARYIVTVQTDGEAWSFNVGRTWYEATPDGSPVQVKCRYGKVTKWRWWSGLV